MAEKLNFWKKSGLQDWFLPAEKSKSNITPKGLTPDEVYKYILDKFKESIGQLSFANRVVFYHEYIICFNEEDYKEFLAHKQGLFGIIVHESVKHFYDMLNEYRKMGKTVEPSSSKWVFRLVSHPDYERGDKGFIGKLMPGTARKDDNLRVTFIPRQTGIAQTLDLNQDILSGFTYYSEGYYELPYSADFTDPGTPSTNPVQKAFARLETIMPDHNFRGKKIEYLMNTELVTVSGKDEQRDEKGIFIIASDWVNTPHLSIRYNPAEARFYLASHGEKTIVNEKEVARSDADNPQWVELPFNSKILLNGIIGINIFKP
jgi:hypothetical protein